MNGERGRYRVRPSAGFPPGLRYPAREQQRGEPKAGEIIWLYKVLLVNIDEAFDAEIELK
ncbi:MAG: hypothetical protein K0S46_2478 [Moraxellaceae bacterium]|nr:hypothetical protein [Moraxellaceae bacterium]